ncbi:cell division protein ZipA [Planctobacterium marinum]|uniref:cell division protein ZipA n=1 Tax=Planctobacterium marinum TaxID=1631968 RepID=UPI001E563767|nr:cell division protein ZipA [Planctobacterium marinum]MCC2607315.1 cell division protein ZipA [Planctobacterium marinum]
MDEFRLALIGIGIFAIVGILAHGMWTIRKNNKAKNSEADSLSQAERAEPGIVISDDDPLLSADEKVNDLQYEQDEDTEYDPLVGDVPLYTDSDIASSSVKQSAPAPAAAESTKRENYDEDGIGAVRVVSDAPAQKPEPKAATPDVAVSEPDVAESDDMPEPPSSLLKKDVQLSRKVSADDIPMIDTSIEIEDAPRRGSALKSEHTRTEVVGGNKLGRNADSIAAKAKKLVGRKSEENDTKAKKSRNAEKDRDQFGLDLETSPEREAPTDNKLSADAASEDTQQNEVLILNVRVPEGKAIQGAALLPSLLTLGFKFGEHNMFHRHAASNGKGPRLFTLANMFNPGTFDIDNMENFNTRGLSLFMTLPIEADAHQVFNMMHNAARKLADEFGAQVLDSRRSVLTKQSLQQYVEKIREFERRRMIRRA